MFHYRIVTTTIPIMNLKKVFLDICKQQGEGIKDSERGKKFTIFPTEERRERGGGVKITQVSKLSKSHYTMTW